MGIGGELVGDLEHLLTAQILRRRALFRMTGTASQSWQAEQEIEQMYPGTRCLLLPSATIALSLILELLPIERGKEVLITPYGWVSNWSCIRRAGLVPRFLPINDQLQIEGREVAERLNRQTGAVIVTHLLGRGQQAVDTIARMCAERGIYLLEDIAQSFGVLVGGRRAGTFGTAAWCSLNHHKVLSTGDGGFVLARDEKLFERVCARHDQGNTMQNGKRRPAAVLEPGLSLRVSELTSAVLRAQLARFHLVRARILTIHDAVSAAIETDLGFELLAPSEGDLPFAVLFKLPENGNYPSLSEAGWHIAANVPWLAEHVANLHVDPALKATVRHLHRTAAVGAGFVDRYHSIPIGLNITDGVDQVPALMENLRERLCRSDLPARVWNAKLPA